MKAALGRHLFFDLVADELLVPFGTELPNPLAIKADIARVPVRDVGAFAYAVCERSSGGVIVQTTLSQLSGPLPADKPCVLDAEGGRLSEVTAIISERSGTDSLAVIYNFIEERTQDRTLEYDPEPNTDVFYPAIQMLFDKCAKTPDNLAFLRFCTRGFSIFEDDYELFDRPQELNWNDRDWTERFCHRLARAWRYSDRPIYAQHILQWLQQFERSGFGVEARQLLVYLYHYGYVTEQKIERFRTLSAQVGSAPIGVAIQAPGKSESRIAYKLRPGISLITPEVAVKFAQENKQHGIVNFVCFDDCIGSGVTVANYLFEREYNPCADEFHALYSDGSVKLWVLVYHSDPRGVDRIENHHAASDAVTVRTICPLDETHRVFSDTSRIIPDCDRREGFKTFCIELGEMLFPNSPLGWGNCQWCVAYDYSIPDLSLPILFASATSPSHWMALFPRNR